MPCRPFVVLGTFATAVALLMCAGCHEADVTEPQAPESVSITRTATSAVSGTNRHVSAGWYHSCARRADGTVVCWGWNRFGAATVPIGLTSVAQVSAGTFHTCALKADGTVDCWGGHDNYGQETVDYGQATVPIGLASVAQVSAGNVHTCALKTDGTVVCWGYNGFGEATVPGGLTSVAQVNAGLHNTCVLKTDGTVVCWGSGGGYGQANVPDGLTSVAQVSARGWHTCALKTNGTVVCWGYNIYGGLNVPSDLPPVAQLSAGHYHTCALKNDGTVVCWGYNDYGQANVPSGLTSVAQVSAGYVHTCALKTDGIVVCWGHVNSYDIAPPPTLNVPPTANAGPDLTVEATSPAGASVTLDGSGSSDADDDPVTFTWTGSFGSASGVNPTIALPFGSHVVPLTGRDGPTTSTDDVQITIRDTTAPETGVTAAMDGNGALLSAGSSTLSGSVMIAFAGSDAVGVTGFECKVDAASYAPCVSPLSNSGLAIGNHLFLVRALDAAGNVDGSPASFSWSVITPAKATENLITAIGSMGLTAGTATSLAAPLGQISKLLSDGNPSNDGAACGKLGAFINQVDAKTAAGQLTAAQATALTGAATAVKISLGC